MEERDQLLQYIKKHKALPPGVKDLKGLDLEGLDLEGIDFSMVNLDACDLRNAKLKNCIFFKASLKGSLLDGADISGADFTGADLTGAHMESVKGYEAGFGATRLQNARLFQADLHGSTFTKATLSGADLRCVDFTSSRMREANLSRADFTEDQNYLKEFKEHGFVQKIVYYIWLVTSNCGRSMMLWMMWTTCLTVFFAWLYTLVGVDFGRYPTVLSPIYYSVVTLSTLGYGDVVPKTVPAQLVAMAEVMTGYMMLGGLLSIFANKMPMGYRR